MKYLMIGNEWKDTDVVYVDIKFTPSGTTIKPLSPKPTYTYGCIDDLWDDGKMTIRNLKPGGRQKITRHILRSWGDGDFTFYPHRAGIPYVLIPKEEKHE